MNAWLHPGIRAVFFDAVGTLLFPEPAAPIVYTDVARRRGLQLSVGEVRDRFIAAYREEEQADRQTGWVTSEEREIARWRKIVTETLSGVADPMACFDELYSHFAQPGSWRINPDAASVLANLTKRGLMIGLASNYDSRLWPVLDGFPELKPLRNNVLISAAVGYRKPGLKFFQHLVNMAGHPPQAILFVGDDVENDYHGARAAGLEAVLLEPREAPKDVNRWIANLTQLLNE